MKNLLYLLLVGIWISCDSENANDCFQSTGNMVEKEVVAEPFTRIRIETGASLLLKQGNEQKVVIKTGENLLNDVSVKVEDGILIARDNNDCNLFRDYGVTQIVVTAPNITEIRNASSFNVESDGVLNYKKLLLVSNTNVDVENLKKSGDFILKLDCENLLIRANGQSVFDLKGSASILDIRFEDERPRLEGRELIVQNFVAFHRAANKMIVNPQQSIDAILTGTGDIISVNRPPIVKVEERFTGKLIFED